MEEPHTFFKLNVLRSEPNRRSLQSFQSVVWLDVASEQELKRRLTLQNFLTKKTNSGGFYVNGVQGKQVPAGVGFFKITQKAAHQNIQYVCDLTLPASSPVIVFSVAAPITRKSWPKSRVSLGEDSHSASVEPELISNDPTSRSSARNRKVTEKQNNSRDRFDLASGKTPQTEALLAQGASSVPAASVPVLKQEIGKSSLLHEQSSFPCASETSIPTDSATELLNRSTEFLKMGQSLHKNDPSLFFHLGDEEEEEEEEKLPKEETNRRSHDNSFPESPKDAKLYSAQVCNLLDGLLAELVRLRVSPEMVASILERYTLFSTAARPS